MRYHIPVAAALAGLLVLNGCAAQRPIPTGRIQSGHLEEVLPRSTRVHLALRSGDEIDARVHSSTDSTLVLIRDPVDLVGQSNLVVVPINEIEAIHVRTGNPLAWVMGTVVVVGGIALVAYVITHSAWRIE